MVLSLKFSSFILQISMTNVPSFLFNEQTNTYYCRGSFTTLFIDNLLNQDVTIHLSDQKSIIINGKEITQFDTAGALVLLQLMQKIEAYNNSVHLEEFNPNYLEILKLVKDKEKSSDKEMVKRPVKQSFIEFLGRQTFIKLDQVQGFTILIGALTDKLLAAIHYPKKFHIPSIISNIHTTGLQALPILALLSFLIGVVLAYQMGLQLENYGATSFIAYLSAMGCLREFAPLVTAIIVAGRTSSAFTAQIGSMKINEELDAIETMGLSSVELLVLPKVLALLLIFPLLIFWSDVFSIAGAMYMSKIRLDVSYIEFITRIHDSIKVRQVLLGLYKAPAFAILIALVGCFQGFRVETSATSVGHQTTKSVVQALFLIIIADSVYSVIYSWMHI